MQLENWKQKLKSQVEEGIDTYIKEHGDEHITPSPLVEPQAQRDRLRNELKNRYLYLDRIDDIIEGFQIIARKLHERLSLEEWEKIESQLENIKPSLLKHLEEHADDEEDAKNRTSQPHEWMGLTNEFLDHTVDLIISTFEENDIFTAHKLGTLMLFIAPKRIAGWLATAKYLDYMEEYSKAIELYKKVQQLFVPEPASRVLCARDLIELGEYDEAMMYIEEAEAILNEHPKNKEIWLQLVKDIKAKLNSYKKG